MSSLAGFYRMIFSAALAGLLCTGCVLSQQDPNEASTIEITDDVGSGISPQVVVTTVNDAEAAALATQIISGAATATPGTLPQVSIQLPTQQTQIQQQSQQVVPSPFPSITPATGGGSTILLITATPGVVSQTTGQNTTTSVLTNPGFTVTLPTNCTVRTDWQPYTIQAGDTLGALAISTNTALADLAIGNCLANPDIINVGATVYLPSAPVTGLVAPVFTPVPGATAVQVGYVMVEPALVEGGQYVVAPGQITVRAQGVQNAASVTFYMSAIGTQAQPVLLGTDTNMADGAIITWNLDQQALVVNLWAVGVDAAGTQVATNPILVRSTVTQ